MFWMGLDEQRKCVMATVMDGLGASLHTEASAFQIPTCSCCETQFVALWWMVVSGCCELTKGTTATANNKDDPDQLSLAKVKNDRAPGDDNSETDKQTFCLLFPVQKHVMSSGPSLLQTRANSLHSPMMFSKARKAPPTKKKLTHCETHAHNRHH